jgi:hypothetical protein
MKYLPPPTDENGDPYDSGSVFDLCISRIRDDSKKQRLSNIAPIVKDAGIEYDKKAYSRTFYQELSHVSVGDVAKDEIVKVYKEQMVPKQSKGRPIYDRILMSPAHGKCPFCGIGTVNTLDHYLPKTHFPIFSVTPNNLVPACQWCQREKKEHYPTSEGSQVFHPYFDNYDDEIWLIAEVVKGVPAVFRYSVILPENYPQSFLERANTHLEKLKLRELYSSNAGSELADIRYRLLKLYAVGGKLGVGNHLYEELESAETNHKNSWRSAMYRAAYSSDWFCNGGFIEF